VVALIAAGCAGKTQGGGSATRSRLADCEKSPLSSVDYETRAELDQLLIGRWQRCGAPQARGEDVGVEFAQEGRWYALTRNPRGEVVRRPGIDYSGSWAYLPRGSMDPISHQPSARAFFDLDGVITDAPSFTNAPRQMRILFSPVPSRYVPLDW
jgi:hypothetical protein